MIMSRINPKITGCYESEGELRRGPWTLEEDNLLIQYITCHGEGHWNSLAKFAGLKRTGKSCRLRWLNYLKPDIKRGNLTPHEQLLILELHSKWGNRWSKIAQNLPGRTDNEIKNYWRTRVQKQARQLKVDSNSSNFLEAIRTFWMPRLLEKIEQNSSPVTSSSPSSSTFVTQNCYNNIITATSSVSDQPADVVTNSDSNFQLPAQNLTAGKYQSENPVEDNNNNYCQVGFPSYEMGGRDTLFSERHASAVDWLGEDLGCTFWNTDELWHFRG